MSKVVFFRESRYYIGRKRKNKVLITKISLRYPTINEYLPVSGLPDTHTRRNTERVTGNNATGKFKATNHRSRIDLSIAFIHPKPGTNEDNRYASAPPKPHSPRGNKRSIFGVIIFSSLVSLEASSSHARRHQAKRLRRILGGVNVSTKSAAT